MTFSDAVAISWAKVGSAGNDDAIELNAFMASI